MAASDDSQVNFRTDAALKQQFDVKLAENGETTTDVLRDAMKIYVQGSATLPRNAVYAPKDTELLQRLADFLAGPKDDDQKILVRIIGTILDLKSQK